MWDNLDMIEPEPGGVQQGAEYIEADFESKGRFNDVGREIERLTSPTITPSGGESGLADTSAGVTATPPAGSLGRTDLPDPRAGPGAGIDPEGLVAGRLPSLDDEASRSEALTKRLRDLEAEPAASEEVTLPVDEDIEALAERMRTSLATIQADLAALDEHGEDSPFWVTPSVFNTFQLREDSVFKYPAARNEWSWVESSRAILSDQQGREYHWDKTGTLPRHWDLKLSMVEETLRSEDQSVSVVVDFDRGGRGVQAVTRIIDQNGTSTISEIKYWYDSEGRVMRRTKIITDPEGNTEETELSPEYKKAEVSGEAQGSSVPGAASSPSEGSDEVNTGDVQEETAQKPGRAASVLGGIRQGVARGKKVVSGLIPRSPRTVTETPVQVTPTSQVVGLTGQRLGPTAEDLARLQSRMNAEQETAEEGSEQAVEVHPAETASLMEQIRQIPAQIDKLAPNSTQRKWLVATLSGLMNQANLDLEGKEAKEIFDSLNAKELDLVTRELE